MAFSYIRLGIPVASRFLLGFSLLGPFLGDAIFIARASSCGFDRLPFCFAVHLRAMPVIASGEIPEVRISYVVVGLVVLCCVWRWMRRREEEEERRIRMEGRNTRWPGVMQQIAEEKETESFNAANYSNSGLHLPSERPPHFQPPPFPPPSTVPTNQETPLSNASYYDRNEVFDDQPPAYFEPASFAQNDGYEGDFGLPRRRSYTKRMSLDGDGNGDGNGMVEVSGEIMIAEGWRRHTRVFGGGVCRACEESDERRRTIS